MTKRKESVIPNSINQQNPKRNKEERKQLVLESTRKRTNEITGISKYLLIKILKDPDWLVGLKNKIQLFIYFKGYTSLAKTHTD
jgi:hypothetical protein